MKQLKVWAVAFLAGVMPVCAQTVGRSMSVDDLVAWQRISQQKIADNGQWVACKMQPWKGDATVYVYGKRGEEVAAYRPADKFDFSPSSSFLVVSEVPAVEEVETLKLKKTKKEQMPMDALMIRMLKGGEERIDSVRNYRMAQEVDWIAYQRGRKDSTLYVRTLDGKIAYTFSSVTDYGFAKESGMLYYRTEKAKNKQLYVLNVGNGQSALLKEGKGEFLKVAFDDAGTKLAFLYTADKKQAYKNTQLWLSDNLQQAQCVVEAGQAALPAGWVVSEYSSLDFSKSSTRLFFGTSPEPRQADTLQLAENRPGVQVWSWDEPVQYTVQQYNKEKDLKKTYGAVYQLAQGKVLQLATEEQPNLMVGNEGDGDYAVTATSRPYSLSSMWEGRTRSDYDKVSLTDGQRTPLSRADYGSYALSPAGKYAYWYGETDSCWYTISLADGVKHRLSTPETFVAWDEENDVPDYPMAYGAAGWSADDEALFLYDRYDIWKFDPLGVKAPVNMTVNGRANKIVYRWQQLDSDARFIPTKEYQMLKGTNEITKGDGYYRFRFHKPAVPKTLIAGDFMLTTIDKAKEADRLIFTMERYEMYPDIHYTNMDFKSPIQLTEGYKQQQQYLWGTTELVKWTSLDGQELEGVIYKPANFDPTKKYPMMVSFYERNAYRLHKYRTPEPHRSTIDYHMYNSNGYIVFNPDIRYRDGHPGESAYNCIIPGIQMIIDRGYVDETAIGAQGHSWGGYQTAYLVTRTHMFAAIESGAPVVNMFSAFGGIRWGSGLARAFQYEHTQSRLGTDPWTGPEIYKENSPLFTMDKVQTPVLIMHNDNDGHVPWYQGIEYFVAMKRLGKPCWLLNYTGEIHWPMRLANRIDFQKRMQQFFNHYLKKEPMPQWMEEGLPAVDEPFELGY